MAKRPTTSTEAKVEAFTEDLGRLLGTARAKADSWLNQRQEIVKHLTGIRDTASNLLTQLGHKSQEAIKRGRAAFQAAADGSNQVVTVVGGKKKRRRMSKAARAKIAAAQRARWAKVKAGKSARL
jgi:hypothetical protein